MSKALAALALLLFSACSPSKPPQGGEAYYKALNCRSCHAIGAEGALSGPDLTFVGFRKPPQWLDLWLKDPQAWKKDAQMPNPHLSDAARHAIVDYLSQQKGQGFASGRPWDAERDPVQRGRVLFARAGCVACHGKDGTGGYPNNNVAGGKIPALTAVSDTYTKEELIRKIKNGSRPQKADPNGPEPMIAMPAWGQVLSDDEISAAAAYLFSLKPAGAKAEF